MAGFRVIGEVKTIEPAAPPAAKPIAFVSSDALLVGGSSMVILSATKDDFDQLVDSTTVGDS